MGDGDIEYGDITSEEAVAFCLKDAEKWRADTLALTQVKSGLQRLCSHIICSASVEMCTTARVRVRQ